MCKCGSKIDMKEIVLSCQYFHKIEFSLNYSRNPTNKSRMFPIEKYFTYMHTYILIHIQKSRGIIKTIMKCFVSKFGNWLCGWLSNFRISYYSLYFNKHYFIFSTLFCFTRTIINLFQPKYLDIHIQMLSQTFFFKFDL